MSGLRVPKCLFLAAITAASMVLPATAMADTAAVSGGVLNYTAGTGTVDTVRLSSGTNAVVISETTSPYSGSIGPKCTMISLTAASCTTASSVNLQSLDLNDSIVNDSALGGRLDGGSGDDTVTGGAPSETIIGGDGDDVITGNGGTDVIDAGAGNDRIDTRDGVAESVNCGVGTDTILADEADLLTNCEAEAPAGTTDLTSMPLIPSSKPATGTDGSDGSTPDSGGTGGSDQPISAPGLLKPVTIAGPVSAEVAEGSEVGVSAKGSAPFVLGCSAQEAKACSGVIFIDPVPASKKSRKKAKGSSVRAFMARRGRYGNSPFKIKPGDESKVDVKLTGVAMKALGKPRGRKARSARRGRRVRAVVTIAPTRARAQRVTITLKG